MMKQLLRERNMFDLLNNEYLKQYIYIQMKMMKTCYNSFLILTGRPNYVILVKISNRFSFIPNYSGQWSARNGVGEFL